MDKLSRILVEIRRTPNEIDDALREHVESEARDLSGEALATFMHTVYGRVHGLIQRCVYTRDESEFPCIALFYCIR